MTTQDVYETFYNQITLDDDEKSMLDEIFNQFSSYDEFDKAYGTARDTDVSVDRRVFKKFRKMEYLIDGMFRFFLHTYPTFQMNLSKNEFFLRFRAFYITISSGPNNNEIPIAVSFADGDRDHNYPEVYAERVQSVNDATADIIANADVIDHDSQTGLTATRVRHVNGYLGGRRKSRRNRKSNRKTPHKNIKKSKRQRRRR